MRQAILGFIWKHIRKIISAAFMAFCYGVWSFIQMPYKASADIVELKEAQAEIHRDMRSQQVTIGTNSLLLQRMDAKLDKLQESIIRLEVQRRTPAYQ